MRVSIENLQFAFCNLQSYLRTCTAMMIFIIGSQVFAQSPSPPAGAGEAATHEADVAGPAGEPLTPMNVTLKKAPPGNLWEMIAAGGPLNIGFMAFLSFISLVAAATAMERLAHLTRRRGAPPHLAG